MLFKILLLVAGLIEIISISFPPAIQLLTFVLRKIIDQQKQFERNYENNLVHWKLRLLAENKKLHFPFSIFFFWTLNSIFVLQNVIYNSSDDILWTDGEILGRILDGKVIVCKGH